MVTLETHTSGKYQVITIPSILTPHSSIAELKSLIFWYIGNKKKHIAICFAQNSTLGPDAIASFVECVEKIFAHQGSLAIINPDDHIRQFLHAIDFDHTITSYANEEELLLEKNSV